ncbi:MAG: hypothetical protein HYY68_07340 [Thaumarchaeota archaeon]|nr:hypothetical protein [Nitrososphaerota archaeon]
MSNAIKSGAEAILIARQAAQASGLILFTIIEAKQENYGTWIVKVESFGNEYQATIDSTGQSYGTFQERGRVGNERRIRESG